MRLEWDPNNLRMFDLDRPCNFFITSLCPSVTTLSISGVEDVGRSRKAVGLQDGVLSMHACLCPVSTQVSFFDTLSHFITSSMMPVVILSPLHRGCPLSPVRHLRISIRHAACAFSVTNCGLHPLKCFWAGVRRPKISLAVLWEAKHICSKRSGASRVVDRVTSASLCWYLSTRFLSVGSTSGGCGTGFLETG